MSAPDSKTTTEEIADLAALRYSLRMGRLLRQIAAPIVVPDHRRSFERMAQRHADEARRIIGRLIFRMSGHAG